MLGSWQSITYGGARFVLQARLWFKDQLRMLQQAKIMWDDDLVIQRMSDEMEFAVTYSIPDVYFTDELWISAVQGATALSRPGTVPGGFLKMNPCINSAATISKRCKVLGRSHRDCILEWARLNPEKISRFLDRMAMEPGWQIVFRGLYDCLRLLYLRLFNEEARTVEMMESQFTHRIEMMLAEERVCLERHKEELAVRQARVLYLESLTSEDAAFKERTEWRKKLPALPRWPSRRKANKRKPRG